MGQPTPQDAEAATYAINKLPTELRDYAWAYWKYRHGQEPYPQPKDYGLDYGQGQMARIKLAQLS